MDKQPKDIMVVLLECVLMPNGEVISNGKTVGWFDKLGKYLHQKPNTKTFTEESIK